VTRIDDEEISVTQQLASAPKSIRAEFRPRPGKLGIANNIFMVKIGLSPCGWQMQLELWAKPKAKGGNDPSSEPGTCAGSQSSNSLE
jgi:hypothetical protein